MDKETAVTLLFAIIGAATVLTPFFIVHSKNRNDLKELKNELSAQLANDAEVKEYDFDFFEATGNESEVEMVKSIISDLKVIDQELAKGIEFADEANDDVSADMITGIRASLQKHIWMLTAFLG